MSKNNGIPGNIKSLLHLDDPFGLLADLKETGNDLDMQSIMHTLSRFNVYSDSSEQAYVNRSENCRACGGQMTRSSFEIEHTCADCGLTVEIDINDSCDAEDSKKHQNACLRIVGSNGNLFQSDLYRSNTPNNEAMRHKQILDEYKTLRDIYIESGGIAIPLDACSIAAEHYNCIQKQYVKRSQNKKAIMAACLYQACIEQGFSPNKSQIAEFMQLNSSGIAKGCNFVRALVADGKMQIDINIDPCRPEITTLFAHLGLENTAYIKLMDVVEQIVKIAIDNSIGTSSMLRSKVEGATYEVLRRVTDRKLLSKPIGIKEFCQDNTSKNATRDRIRRHTVERFTGELNTYHSYFEVAYAEAGLNSEIITTE